MATRLKERIGADVFVAMDVPSLIQASELENRLLAVGDASGFGYKLGLELCSAEGVGRVVSSLLANVPKFIDLKLNDIPTTVGKTVAVLRRMAGVRIINVMANCGRDSMLAAVANKGNSLIFAVTVLTSLTEYECSCVYGVGSQKGVNRLVTLAADAGVDGIICAPSDLVAIRDQFPNLFMLCPGVRPSWASNDDQQRIMTPYDAIMAGADGIVIGRPVTNPLGKSPKEALSLVLSEISLAHRHKDRMDKFVGDEEQKHQERMKMNAQATMLLQKRCEGIREEMYAKQEDPANETKWHV